MIKTRSKFCAKRVAFVFAMVAPQLVAAPAHACLVANPAADFNAKELVDNTRNIFLVRAVEEEVMSTSVNAATGETSGFPEKLFTFEILEVLKGEAVSIQAVRLPSSKRYEHVANDFDDHADEIFWERDGSRSEWHSASCGSVHTYQGGEIYLLFPDALNARKSAELIKSPDDKWLQFVRERIFASQGPEAKE